MPCWSMAFTVVGRQAATVMISSPGFKARSPRRGEVSAESASRFADDPELVVSAKCTPRYLARRCSNASLKRPVVSQPSREASTMFCSSGAPITLPEGGTVDWPATNGRGAEVCSAYLSTNFRISRLSSSTSTSSPLRHAQGFGPARSLRVLPYLPQCQRLDVFLAPERLVPIDDFLQRSPKVPAWSPT